jgi:CheY-like chemotaxis protein
MTRIMTRRLLVAIVFEDSAMRDRLSTSVEALRHDVLEFVSAEEFMTCFGADPCDILLVDDKLPRVTGLGVLKFVREQPGGRHLPIVVFSYEHMREAIERDNGIFVENEDISGFYQAVVNAEVVARNAMSQ